ncbi:patatin-like protein [Sphingomonas lenta]|uniref:Patatin n=1 Tax=Sphingomonas lenta TaxID=1141887 RepID=A0A2A2SH32_9SPHN|nr:patatin-like protein [Sphingomonas lenta]PAX08525.1 patatin [Sphingomonas lenta]
MREKELRLALVCYGGVSLAVYMHGITKEVWHLAAASRAYAEGVACANGSRRVYADLLAEIERAAGVRLRVLADIVAGASAGGINGVFLAQAVATGQSLDPLTDLWLDHADVESLIDPEAAPAGRFSRVWAMPLAWLAGRRGTENADPADAATRDEVRAKISHFVRSRWFEPPFGGKTLTGLVLDALDAMRAGERGPRLLPADQPLDLFVTVTEFLGHPERLRLHSPHEVVETEHRLVIDFTDNGDPCDTLAHPAELTFAARATSSFPGAFPPFTVTELDGVLAAREASWAGRRSFLRRVLPRQTAANALDTAVLIDGSVLANAPFGPAMAALKDRPARREVDRRFVYIDPSPGIDLRVSRAEGPPGFFQTILGALSDLPRAQPIRDNLEAIAARSARIETMRAMVDALRTRVDAEVERLFGRTFFLDRPTPARLVAWRRRAQIGSMAAAGYAHAAYGLLKITALADQLTELLAGVMGDAREERRTVIRTAIARWLDARGVAADPEGETAVDFFRRFDWSFRVRRLRLLARRLAEAETAGETPGLPELRKAIYDSLGPYLDGQRPRAHRQLRRDIRRMREDAGPVLDRLAQSLDLARLDAETDERLSAALALLPRETRRQLLLAYLGFPYFDTATLPLLQGEGLDEFDPIKVDRISPEDARSVREGGAAATLKGIQFGTFGAFFSRAYRENDYLWGRLHGAERMIDIAVSALPPGQHLAPGRVAAIKRDAFLAILAEEEPRLTAIPSLFESLRREIG